MKNIYIDTSERLCNLISKTEFKDLPLGIYHTQYFDTLLQNLHYYANIYAKCFSLLDNDTPLQDIICVDYGGGCGLLSIYAKLLGIGTVIYIDINPLSVNAAEHIFKRVGYSADIVLKGDTSTLKSWCKTSNIHPTSLVSTDVIEHIYDLDDFFNTLRQIKPDMQMVFTTASVADNPFKSHRLHKIMKKCERNYFAQRLDYIQNKFPDIQKPQALEYAGQTRGLIYQDIDAVILGKSTTPTIDKYNTCNPETGNFVERILTIDQYRHIVKPLYIISHNGFYNTKQKSLIKRSVAKFLNLVINTCPKIGKTITPFIFIQISPK
ncbi:MAG: 50S ribosomal protein L11 methyltransferase [Paludibacteraceae bacterium]|nr:50S ribosomal protein L11 methyltransferase [Paludibacteraceae bacterium]